MLERERALVHAGVKTYIAKVDFAILSILGHKPAPRILRIDHVSRHAAASNLDKRSLKADVHVPDADKRVVDRGHVSTTGSLGQPPIGIRS